MQKIFGKDNFNFIPDTFVIPDEYSDFCAQFNLDKKRNNEK
jgi:Tubulin-tyrosine ligase family